MISKPRKLRTRWRARAACSRPSYSPKAQARAMATATPSSGSRLWGRPLAHVSCRASWNGTRRRRRRRRASRMKRVQGRRIVAIASCPWLRPAIGSWCDAWMLARGTLPCGAAFSRVGFCVYAFLHVVRLDDVYHGGRRIARRSTMTTTTKRKKKKKKARSSLMKGRENGASSCRVASCPWNVLGASCLCGVDRDAVVFPGRPRKRRRRRRRVMGMRRRRARHLNRSRKSQRRSRRMIASCGVSCCGGVGSCVPTDLRSCALGATSFCASPRGRRDHEARPPH